MSFGGFGGFGSNNNNTQASGTGFGGFGSSTNNNATPAFGSSTTGGFGGNTGTTGGGLFGANNNTTSGGFGGSPGFGSNANNTGGFGANKPAFGGATTTGGGLFGSNNTTPSTGSAFGGFGANNTNNNTSGAFGSSTGGGLFGANQNKPAFGASTTNTGFGGGNTANTAFGASTTGGFGQSTGGFGQQQNSTVNQGTGSTPFSAYQEKDGTANNTSHYQSISFMQPYQNFSFEELRLADYAAGRKYGNSNGQAGAFGQSTGFGGFGSNNTASTTGGFGGTTNNTTSGGLFGANNTNSTAQPSPLFGQQNTAQNNTTTGFNSNAGGLFGQNKPATGGLFGASNTPSTTAGGGLFGANNNTANTNTSGGAFGGFGANNNTANNTTGGGLFGANNNQTQNKPAFGGFGANNNTSTTTPGAFGSSTGGFGQNNASTGTGGLFGNNNSTNNTSGGGLFGANNNNQTQPTTSAFGGFGANNNTNNTTQPNNTGGSLFGGFGQNNNNNNTNEQKPGGLFGNNTNTGTGGGMFGQNNNNQQQQNTTGGGLFGNNNNQQQSGGLFGNKPATGTSGGLFGNTNTTTTTGGGLFGGQQQQQQQSTGGMFGQNNNNTQQKSLFGGGGTTGGGGLFGNTLGQNNNNNNAGNSLFGGSQQNNAGNSLFGNSQQQQNQPQSLTASLTQNPYGNDQLFAGLGLPSPSVGPIATPLSGAQKPAKRTSMVPPFKINPSASMRLITPQKRPTGYGFSYSTYGTPGSAQQSFTPGRTSLFGSGGPQKPLSKSLSTSNLRSPLSQEDSVLAPGAFTPNYRPYSSGNSIRRLKIDRSLRTDLFADPSAERNNKRVSFDANGTGKGAEPQTNGNATPGPNNALVRTESDSVSPDNARAKPVQKETPRTNGNSSRPEMEQVRGNELAIVPEDEQVHASAPPSAKPIRRAQIDQTPGEYYMIPSMQDIRDMSRDQLKNVQPFIVGRIGIGKIEFDRVDLSEVDLDKILGDTVKLNVRSATVYETAAITPPQGKGLNVPSTIILENSWPRSSGGRLPVHERKGTRFEKHVERLRRVGGTEFLDYSPDSGEWTFRVQHFTTYGLDDDDDESMLDQTDYAQNTDNTTPKVPAPVAAAEPLEVLSTVGSDLDDTFDFKKSARTIPGGFGGQSLFYDDFAADALVAHEDEVSEAQYSHNVPDEAFEVGSIAQEYSIDADMEDDDQLAIGAFPPADIPAPKSILKSTNFAGTPPRSTFQPNDDWADQLQRTVSPRKQDRRALREQQHDFFNAPSPSKPALGRPSAPKAFSTTMDIMDSLFTQPKANAKGRGGPGFEWPYQKRANGDADASNMTGNEQAFHTSVKPRWSADGTLSYAVAGNAPALNDGVLVNAKASLIAEGKDVRFASVQASPDTHNAALTTQLDTLEIDAGKDGVPVARISGQKLSFQQIFESVANDHVSTPREREVWKLAAILFDPVEVSCRDHAQGVPAEALTALESKIRREAILDFWRELTRKRAMTAFRDAADYEEKAFACLSCGDIEGACTTLVDGRNYHLATMVAQLQSGPKAKELLRKQIEVWRAQNVTSDIPPAIRAIYELLAGNAAVSEGKNGAQEDRARTIHLSQEFGLNWQQSLGLRLWYSNDDIGAAVQSYLDDVKSGKELIKPSPAVTEGTAETVGSDAQDGLLVLLRLYAAQQDSSVTINAAELFSPIALSGNPLNARLSWQLATLLKAKSLLSSDSLSSTTLDSLTTSVAAQLETQSTATSILTASTVLLHLSTPALRSSAIQSLLTRRVALLTPAGPPFAIEPTQDSTLQYLLKTHIPAAWLHSARALHAAATGAYPSQVAHLLLANARAEAHTVLCTHVGPSAVISRDFDALRELLGHFGPAPHPDIPAWSKGGQLLFDYVHLLDLSGPRADEKEKTAILERLLAALPAARQADMGLERRVAVAEMSRVVGLEWRALGGQSRGLGRLPVADDSYARQGGKLWDLYGRALRVR